MSWLLPVTAALVILVVVPHTFFSFDVAPKVVLLMAGVALALLVSANTGLSTLARTRRGKWLLAIAALQTGSIIVSTASSLDPGLSLYGTAWRRFGLISNLAVLLFALLLAGQATVDAKAISRFLKATSIAGCLGAVYGILQYLGWDPILPAGAYRVGEGIWSIVRPPGTLGHASYFATFLLYAVFGSVALGILEAGQRWRWIAGASATVGIVAIVLSGTRAAILGLAAGGLILFIARRPRIRRAHTAAAALILCAAAGFYVSPLGDRLRARARWSQEDSAGGARLMLWKDSLAMSAAHPVFGYGPEVFTTEFPRHQSIELARLFPDFYQESPHNVFLDVLAAQGGFGLALLAALSVLALTSWKAGPWNPPLAAGFAAGLVSQQFGAFTVPTALYFYTFAALLSTASEFVGSTVEAAPSLSNRALRIAVAIGLLWFAAQLTISDVFFGREKEEILHEQIESAITARASGSRWASGGTGLAWRGSSYDLYFSRAWLQLSEKLRDPARRFQAWQQGMASALRAPSNSDDRANALVNLAAFQASLDNAPAVERTLLAAIAQAPNWFRPHWLLARLYLTTGHLQEAEEQAKLAVDRNGNRNPEVAETLAAVRKARRGN